MYRSASAACVAVRAQHVPRCHDSFPATAPRDPRVTSLQFQQCCRRLVEHAGSLSVALEGQSVRVSVAHGLPTWESPYIDIAWDFSH